eukprot:TRINITY_DN14116_c0_g1_i3.p1 TRINITY_DN14116_c0_g1~~TRINITY_DN14116_c0_g1_i3.p1  ORF type:complete len:354 (-),score=108.26 TRINITY_DN14116_c0_g1_i3:120-1181(-)
MLDLMLAALTDAKLDSKDRALELLKASKANMESHLRSSGNSLAMTHIAARRSLAGYISEITGGLAYYDTLKTLVETADKDWPSLLGRLESMRSILVNRKLAVVSIAGDAATLSAVKAPLDAFVKSLPEADEAVARKLQGETVAEAEADSKKFRVHAGQDGFVVPTQVNFVAKGGGLFKPGDKISGASQVIVRFLSNSYMWDKVRVMGGAYGSSCSVSPLSGTFMCMSYRDPNLAETLATYDGIAKYLESLSLDAKAVEQLIIGAVSDLDHPTSPAQEGYTCLHNYLTGQTLDVRQRWRDEVFATTPQDFQAFANRLRDAEPGFQAVAFGSEEAFSKANKVLSKEEQLKLHTLA